MTRQGELPGGNLRASDAERTRTADELRVHCLAGRITVDELEQRVAQAMSAKTVHELAELLHDLPPVATPPSTREPTTPAHLGPPGVRPFTRRIVVPASPQRTRTVALDTIAPALNGYSYELTQHSPAGLTFERSGRPVWTFLVAFFLFPFGLLALKVKHTERIVISIEQHGAAQTTMVIHGSASRRVRKAFAELRFA
jgi:hypothetical protein